MWLPKAGLVALRLGSARCDSRSAGERFQVVLGKFLHAQKFVVML